MKQSISKLFAIIAVSLIMAACATTSPQTSKHKLEQLLLSDGAKHLTAAETKAHLSGMTQQWLGGGGAYFKEDGDVIVKWSGRIYPKRYWTVDDTGRVCIAFPDGFVSSCSRYYDKDGEIWVVTLEIFGEPQTFDGGPDTILPGNQLAEIK